MTTFNNMGLTWPDIGSATYPAETDASAQKIDEHDHTAGKGVQIPTGGLANGAVTGVKLNANVVDDSTIEIDSNQIRVKDLGIPTAKIADGAVTQAKRAALGQQLSSSSGTFFTSSNTPDDVTNLSVTITTTGRPVVLTLISDSSSNSSEIAIGNGGAVNFCNLLILRDSTEVMNQIFGGNPTPELMSFPPSAIKHIDIPSAGTYTYKVQASVSVGSDVGINYCKLIAYEL